MRGDSFLLKHRQAVINGSRQIDVRPGYEISDRGKVTWMSREEFEQDFVEVGSDG